MRLLYLLLFPILLFADRVTLTNGDTITGAVVKKDGDKLTIKSEFLGEVTMPWSAVKSLESEQPVTVVLPGGQAVQGKLNTSGNELEVTTPSGPRNAPLAGVSAIRNPEEQRKFERLEHPGPLQLWTGFFDLGLALARGNAHTDTLTTAVNASRVSHTSKTTLYFNQIYGSARVAGITATNASAVRGGWAFNRNFDSRWFATVFNDYEHDRFQNLDLRFAGGGGLGYTAVKHDGAQLDLIAGADYDRENFSTGLTRNFAEGNFADTLLYKLSGITTLTQSFRFFSNLSDTGEYRINFDLGAVTTLKKWLGWQVTASDRFLSNPVVGRQRNDLLLSTGFRVSFGQ